MSSSTKKRLRREHRTLKKKGLRPKRGADVDVNAREHRTLKKKGLRRHPWPVAVSYR